MGGAAAVAEANDIPEEVDHRLAEIETALAALDERPVIYDPAEIARAGAFVSIDGSGALRIERGYVRPEDEPPVAPPADGTVEGPLDEADAGTPCGPDNDGATAAGEAAEPPEPPEVFGERIAQRKRVVRRELGDEPVGDRPHALKEPHQIRHTLTEGAVRSSDKRAQFVGVEAYEDAGGVILRDLFNADDGGWLQDPGLLDRLVTEKLERDADCVRAEGWKWVEVAPDFPYGHTYDLRRLIGEQRPLTEQETAAHDALRAEFDKLEETYAFVAALHVLCLKLFYRYALDSCLEIEPKSAMFGGQAPGLADTASAKAIEGRHAAWAAQLPKEPAALWNAVVAFDHDSRQALFAHCVSLTVNAVSETYNRRPRAIAHADRIAQAVALDVAAVGWRPTVENYLGRVTKGRILQAVSEARGDLAAVRIRSLKKPEMAKAAEDLLIGAGWLPEPLRTPGQTFAPGVEPVSLADAEVEAQSADDGGEPAMDESTISGDASEPSAAATAIAAE